jgi:hypothetical protein
LPRPLAELASEGIELLAQFLRARNLVRQPS